MALILREAKIQFFLIFLECLRCLKGPSNNGFEEKERSEYNFNPENGRTKVIMILIRKGLRVVEKLSQKQEIGILL